MFKSIEFLLQGPFPYRVVDDDFAVNVGVPSNIKMPYIGKSHVRRAMAVIAVYQNRGLCVPKNLALFYRYTRTYNDEGLTIRQRIDRDAESLATYYPASGYEKRYYGCLRRQLAMMEYSGK